MPRFYALLLAGWVLAPLPPLAATMPPTRQNQLRDRTCSVALPPLTDPADRTSRERRQRYHLVAPPGGTGQGNFEVPATNPEPTVGSNPFNVVVGDVDSDGDLDLLTVNATPTGTVSVRLNDGRGNFTAPATNPDPAVGDSPMSVAVGDVDGDGDLDFLTANNHSRTVSVRLNDGRGNFIAPVTNPEPTVGFNPISVAVGDVDGDGDLDFLTANNDNTVSVRLNNGRGSFSAPTGNPELAVGDYPYSVVMGDVDGDGDVDFLTANNNGTVSVRLNDGRGNFTAPATNPEPTVAGRFPQSVAVGDVDGDGDLDLLTANNNLTNGTVSVRLNDSKGNFTAPAINPDPAVGSIRPRSVVVGDLDGDGDLDLLTANLAGNGTVSVRLNQPAVPLPVRAASTVSAPTLFPNPTRGSLTLLGAAASVPVEVFNALGRLVLRTSTDATGAARLVLPSGLASGVYVVRTGEQVLRVVLD